MTIDKPRSSRLGRCVLLCAVLACGCADTQKTRRGDQIDVSGFPPEIQSAYEVFASRCSRCHTLARPLNARISDPQHWIRYVQRMRLQPASGIDARNGEIIVRFLVYYHGSARNPAPAAPATSGGSHE
jgi:hypothetical protein